VIHHPVIGPACPLELGALSLALYGAWTSKFERIGLEVVQDCRIWIPGRPVPKGRPRAWQNRLVTPAATRRYERVIGAACDRVDVDVPSGDGGLVVGVHVFAVHRRTGRETAKKRRGLLVKSRHRSDLDNVAKSVLDGVQRSRLLVDDSHVVALDAWRMVAPPDQPKLEGVIVGLAWARVVDR